MGSYYNNWNIHDIYSIHFQYILTTLNHSLKSFSAFNMIFVSFLIFLNVTNSMELFSMMSSDVTLNKIQYGWQICQNMQIIIFIDNCFRCRYDFCVNLCVVDYIMAKIWLTLKHFILKIIRLFGCNVFNFAVNAWFLNKIRIFHTYVERIYREKKFFNF